MVTISEPKPGLGKGIKLAMHSMYGIRRACPSCYGSGCTSPVPSIFNKLCPKCHGAGEVRYGLRRQPFLFGHRLESNHVISLTSLVWLYPRFFVFQVHTGWWGIEYRTRDTKIHNSITVDYIAKVHGEDVRDDGYLYEHKRAKS